MGRRKTVNDFLVDGDSAAILCVRQDLSVVKVWIDAPDIDMVKCHKWSVGISPWGYFFTQTSAWEPGVGQYTIRLGRYLLKPPAHLEVDHIDRNPLNFRRSNLRLVTHFQNQQNLSPSGMGTLERRGVSLSHGRYVSRVTLHGEVHQLGRFADLDTAAKTAADFRAAHMPFSPEAMRKGKDATGNRTDR